VDVLEAAWVLLIVAARHLGMIEGLRGVLGQAGLARATKSPAAD
jgi:hypothetical protein